MIYGSLVPFAGQREVRFLSVWGKAMKASTTWILVADGARARILVNEGPGKGLKPSVAHDFAVPQLPSREIGAERPGRVHESLRDGSRHAMEPPVDWHRYEKSLFARDLAKQINKAAYRGAFDRLVLVLPAKSLGDLRAQLNKDTRARVVAELSKDLTHVPLHELPGHLSSVVRL